MAMSEVAYQSQEEKLLPDEVKEKLGSGKRVDSFDKKKADTKGTTTIRIGTENYTVILGATDLGAWFERVNRHFIF